MNPFSSMLVPQLNHPISNFRITHSYGFARCFSVLSSFPSSMFSSSYFAVFPFFSLSSVLFPFSFLSLFVSAFKVISYKNLLAGITTFAKFFVVSLNRPNWIVKQWMFVWIKTHFWFFSKHFVLLNEKFVNL